MQTNMFEAASSESRWVSWRFPILSLSFKFCGFCGMRRMWARWREISCCGRLKASHGASRHSWPDWKAVHYGEWKLISIKKLGEEENGRSESHDFQCQSQRGIQIDFIIVSSFVLLSFAARVVKVSFSTNQQLLFLFCRLSYTFFSVRWQRNRKKHHSKCEFFHPTARHESDNENR